MNQHLINRLTEPISGYLLASRQAEKASDWLCVAESGNLMFECNLDVDGWYLLTFQSHVPLADEPPEINPPYKYIIVIRTSGHKALWLSPTKDLIDYFLDKKADWAPKRHLYKVSIDVDSFVKHMAEEPSDYMVSFVHSRVNAFKDNLNAVSFYGNDLLKANYFRESMEFMTFHTCGLRSKSSRKELVRLGSDGYVFFSYFNSDRGASVDAVLKYMSTKGYLREDY